MLYTRDLLLPANPSRRLIGMSHHNIFLQYTIKLCSFCHFLFKIHYKLLVALPCIHASCI